MSNLNFDKQLEEKLIDMYSSNLLTYSSRVLTTINQIKQLISETIGEDEVLTEEEIGEIIKDNDGEVTRQDILQTDGMEITKRNNFRKQLRHAFNLRGE